MAEAVIEDAEGVQIRFVGALHFGEQILGRPAFFLRSQHRRGAMSIVAAEITDLVAAQALEAAPDVGLDVLGQMADMEIRVDVGQRARHQDPSTRHRFSLPLSLSRSGSAGLGRLPSGSVVSSTPLHRLGCFVRPPPRQARHPTRLPEPANARE